MDVLVVEVTFGLTARFKVATESQPAALLSVTLNVPAAFLKDALKEKALEPFKEANKTAMFRGGASYADAITFGAEKVEKKLVEEFSKVRGKKTLQYNPDSDLTDYLQLYGDLANK